MWQTGVERPGDDLAGALVSSYPAGDTAVERAGIDYWFGVYEFREVTSVERPKRVVGTVAHYGIKCSAELGLHIEIIPEKQRHTSKAFQDLLSVIILSTLEPAN